MLAMFIKFTDVRRKYVNPYCHGRPSMAISLELHVLNIKSDRERHKLMPVNFVLKQNEKDQ